MGDSQSKRLTIALLGAPIVTQDEQELMGFSYDKVRALLYYLAVESERAQQRDVIAELLWPEQPAGVARSNLRQALLNLRYVLGNDHVEQPYLIIARNSLQLNTKSNTTVDVSLFTALVGAVKRHVHQGELLCDACVEQLERAAELYRGDFLAHFLLPDNLSFTEWVEGYSARLHHEALFVFTQLLAYYLAQSCWKRTRHYALRVLSLEPWDEQAQRCLMRLSAQEGQRHAAMQQYERYRALLHETFGLEPEQETVALAADIRAGSYDPPQTKAAGAPGRPAPAAHEETPAPSRPRLPTPLFALIGRERELAGVGALLSAPDVRLLTISGPGGIGKTRFSLEVARTFESCAPDGIWFVSLAAVQDQAEVAQTIAQALGVKPAPGEGVEEALVSWLATRAVLLVLDNVEHVLDVTALIDKLLRGTTNLKLLVTSRILLRLYGEWEFRLPPLQVPPRRQELPAAELLQAPAVQLFTTRARAADALFAVSPADAGVLAEICWRLDGLPLAIELAAARSKLMSLPSLLARLNRRLEFLVDGPQNSPARQQALRATIDWSYQLLAAGEQHMFAWLAIFAGSWDLAAVEAVVPRPDGAAVEPEAQASDVLRAIESLLNQNMIQRSVGASGVVRFTMLDMLREYALERLHSSAADQAAAGHHARYYLGLAELKAQQIPGPDADLALEALEQELGNLRAAFHWFVAHDHTEAALGLCAALWHFWRLRGYQGEGARWAEQALALRPDDASRLRADVLYGAGWIAHDQGDYVRALRYYEQSLAIRRDLGDQRGIAEALQGVGEMAKRARDYQRALACFTQSMELYRILGDEEGVAWAFDHLGLIYFAQGNYPQALELIAESLACFRSLEQRWGVAVTLLHAGLTELYQQHFEQARSLLQESYDLFLALGNRLMSAWPFALLGRTALYAGEATACQHLEEALALFRQLGNRLELAKTLACLARAWLYQADYQQALRLSEQSLQLLREHYDPDWMAMALANLGWAALARDARVEAYHHFFESLRLRRLHQELRGVAECLVGIAAVLVLRGDQPVQAAVLIGASLALQHQSGLTLWYGDQALSRPVLARLAEALAPPVYEAALADGRRMSLDEAVERAACWAQQQGLPAYQLRRPEAAP